jgi:hypothetical protein
MIFLPIKVILQVLLGMQLNFLIIILCFALSFLSSYIVVRGVYLDPRDSSSVEKFHMKFIKEILGVHCKASNVACRAEFFWLFP